MTRKHLLCNDRGDLTYFSVFVVLAVNMIIAFVLLYASIEINCINIRNGAKMELNNLSASIYSDTFRSQREGNLSEYWSTLYSSGSYTRQLERMVISGLSEKIELSSDNYRLTNIHLSFDEKGDRIEYVFSCDAEFYIRMFGENFPTVTRRIELTGYHITKY